MELEQENHLQTIKQKFLNQLDFKYRKGQKEHGGNLWDRDVIEDIVDESVDLITYAFTIRENKNKAIHLLKSMLCDLQGHDYTEASRHKLIEVIQLLEGRPK